MFQRHGNNFLARELTNFPNGDGCADVDEGVTDIEAMECRLTWVMGGCTSSKEETENGEEREEMHVASGWRVLPHKGIRKEGDVWAKMERKEKVEDILYFSPKP